MSKCTWCDEETMATCPECKGTGYVGPSNPTNNQSPTAFDVANEVVEIFAESFYQDNTVGVARKNLIKMAEAIDAYAESQKQSWIREARLDEQNMLYLWQSTIPAKHALGELGQDAVCEYHERRIAELETLSPRELEQPNPSNRKVES